MSYAYYNEYDKPTAAWLRELMADGLIADGVVDERSIKDVQPGDLHEFTQCHFFAGIGGWSRALRLAGWPDDKPVWTGSCPCQSFSNAGAKRGFDDPRHLWPAFYRLISDSECCPAQIFGEQVAAAVERGDKDRSWLELVAEDLGKTGYAFGAAVLSAAYVGAPHLRERLYFVADSDYKASRTPKCQPIGDCVDGFWSQAVWERFSDGKRRATKSGLSTLVNGLPGGVELLRGAGNAIVPSQAAEFIRAYIEACE